MPDNIDVLKVRILICFFRMSQESCTVTNLSKTLVVEKYNVSRALVALEKDGLINRENPRKPILTISGQKAAKTYSDRMDIAMNHLIFEGVSPSVAQNDAMYFTLYCSDETFKVIQGIEERARIKDVMNGKKEFYGDNLCKHLKDGSYHLPFVIYREHIKYNSNISMSNFGFEHPCELYVNNKKGVLKLRAVTLTHTALNGIKMKGKISSLQYFDGNQFIHAERIGEIYQFPAEVLHFINLGNSNAQIIHGSVCLKMTSSVGIINMPESQAILTVTL